MDFCEYSNIFGEPGTGLHQYRIFNIAIVDVIATFLLAGLFYYIYNKIDYWTYLIILFIAGIIFHRLFCVRTTIDKLLFPYR